MENSRGAPQKIKNRTTIWSSNSTFGYLLEKVRMLEKIYAPCVHWSIIWSSL